MTRRAAGRRPPLRNPLAVARRALACDAALAARAAASLAATVAAMTDVPIVAVPTSTGQPGSFGGFGALLTMLNAASPGVVVSTIDNGHAAGVFAARIARRTAR